MTTATHASVERNDLRSILGGGIVLGVLTAAGVAVFAFLSRPLSGLTETIVQSILILIGGAVFAYLPAQSLRPRSVDGIAWAAMQGLLGALVFTVIDTALLRPIRLYHWTWDMVGGGSGFWYIPVWWMGSALLAWLGAWVVAARARVTSEVNVPLTAGTTVVLGAVLGLVLMAVGLLPAHAAVIALGFTVGLAIHALASAAFARR